MNIPHLLKGTFWSISDVLLYPLLYFLFTPRLSYDFGLELFGVWCFINSVIVFLQIFNPGLGTHTQRKLAAAIADSDWLGASRLLHSNLLVSLLFITLTSSITIVAAVFQYRRNFLEVSDLQQSNALLSIALCGVIAGLKITEQVLSNALIALGKIRSTAFFNSAVRILVLCVAIGIAQSESKYIPWILLAHILVLITALLIQYFLIRKEMSVGHFTFQLDKKLVVKELSESRMIWFQSILVILAFQSDKLLIAALIGVREFSYYATAATIFNHLHLAIMALTPFALTQLSKKFIAGNNVQAYYFALRSFTLAISFLGFFLLHVLWKPMLIWWIGDDFSMGLGRYIDLFILFELQLIFTISPFYLLNASGNFKLAITNTAVFCGLSFSCAVIAYSIGGTGTAWLFGSCCGLLAAIVIQQYRIAKSFSWKPTNEVLLLPLPFFLLSVGICIQSTVPGVSILLQLGSLVAFFYVFTRVYPLSFIKIFPKHDEVE
jgi:O-antigen/teichoic acid export membrane protein